MKVAIIRWKQNTTNPKRFRAPMQIENVLEVGEGPNFIHVFCDPSKSVLAEVNLNTAIVESVTLYNANEDAPNKPVLLDSAGEPIEGDEVQSEEQLPVEQDDAGSTPVVPAISDAGVV